MGEIKWRAANNGNGKRIWFLVRGEGSNAEYLWARQSLGVKRPHRERLVRFASYESAQRRADQLNATEGG